VKDIVQAIFLGIEKEVSRRAYFLSDGKVYKSRAFSDLIQKELGDPFVIHIKCPLIVRKSYLCSPNYSDPFGKEQHAEFGQI